MNQVNAHKPGYKHTPLGWIPEDWEATDLQKVAFIQQGISKGKKIKAEEEISMPYLRVANVKDGYLDLSEIKYISINRNEVNKYYVKKNDILITEGGDPDKLGRGSIWNDEVENCVFQNHLFRIRCDVEAVNPHFLYNYLQGKKAKDYFLASAKQTTGIASINSSQVKELPVIVPPVNEQKKIVTILSTWDEAIAQTQQLIAKLEQRNKGLMQELLTGKKRLDGFVDEWSNGYLKEISLVKKGKTLSSKDLRKGLIPVIAGGKTSPYSHNEFTDENVITISASGAYAGYIAYHPNKIWASDCSVIKGIEGISDTTYLYYLLHFRQEFVYSLQTGGAQPHVYPKDLEKIHLKIPFFKEQIKISAFLTELTNQVNIHQQQLNKLEQQKKGLMQKLLTGEVRVNP